MSKSHTLRRDNIDSSIRIEDNGLSIPGTPNTSNRDIDELEDRMSKMSKEHSEET